jgi:hypothetical protein
MARSPAARGMTVLRGTGQTIEVTAADGAAVTD